jgi:hypothetical protein
MWHVEWFGPYRGHYTRTDLTDENLRGSLMVVFDELREQAVQANKLLGRHEIEYQEAADYEARHGIQAMQTLPIGKVIEAIWRTARDGLSESDDLAEPITACLKFVHLFMPTGDGPIVVSELDDDDPLLFAWMTACEMLWNRGLRDAFGRAHIWIEYRPSELSQTGLTRA